MNPSAVSRDAVVIGGGFYGCAIAIYLKKVRGFQSVTLVEREDRLLQRASYNNQARVHNGYHYPRSFTTAYRSRINLPRFVEQWPGAVKKDFTKIYAIARNNSKVNGKQFERFCREIGAAIRPVSPALKSLFEPRLIESLYEVDEYAFDSRKLEEWALEELNELGIEILLNSRVGQISKGLDASMDLKITQRDKVIELGSKFLFNCTYSGLNQFLGDYTKSSMGLKHEITEMALVELPRELEGLGVTVMDGPFFSIMPFPARGLHTLSHVRYTPHLQWLDQKGVDPYAKLSGYAKETRVDRMIRDVSRYMPLVSKSIYRDSLFEVKTVLVKNEGDDGRPILFERMSELPNCISVLGGKIDNIYDVLEKLDSESLNLNR